MTQYELADASGVDRATISLLENGHRRPTMETLEKLAPALQAEVGDFFPKSAPSLFDALAQQRGSEWQPAEPGEWRARPSSESPHYYITPELRQALREVERGETSGEAAAPHIVEAVLAALQAGGHAPAT